MSGSILGLDIGGANLKAAHTCGAAALCPFELWRTPAALAHALQDLLKTLPRFDELAVTMTGELCDCFKSRREGVLAILDAVAAVAGRVPVVVWRTDDRFADIAEARTAPLLAASSNWLALAWYAGGLCPHGLGLLIDIGSTTTDLVPLRDGRPVPRGRTDAERLHHGELVYTGVRRTPICALRQDRLAAELFATTLDAYLLLGLIREEPCDCGTADGRPATRALAHARLARMLGADADICPEGRTRLLAEEVRRAQIDRIRHGLKLVCEGTEAFPTRMVLAGSGEFLARDALAGLSRSPEPLVISLTELLGPTLSQAACAYAVAVLDARRPRE